MREIWGLFICLLCRAAVSYKTNLKGLNTKKSPGKGAGKWYAVGSRGSEFRRFRLVYDNPEYSDYEYHDGYEAFNRHFV